MKKFLKYFLIVFLAIFLIEYAQTNVFAAVNSGYYSPPIVEESTLTDDGTNDDVKSKTVGDTIMQYIGRFIYSVASIVEILITNFSKWLFKVDCFPWEDYIVYNSLPYLDINFFNYGQGSIFDVGSVSKVGDMIRTVYFSLLTMAISIIGIGVAITAIRLAISSIAAEKAKYKEAITKCLYTVVMLFCVHFLISFIFYLNETIVSASSTMLKNLINKEEQEMLEAAAKNVDTSAVDKFIRENSMAHPEDMGDSVATLLHPSYVATWDALSLHEDFDDWVAAYQNRYNTQISSLNNFVEYGCDTSMPKKFYAYLLKKDSYKNSSRIDLLFVGGELIGASFGSVESPDRVWSSLLNVQNDVGNLISAYRTYKINTYFGQEDTSLETLRASYSESQRNTGWYKVIENCYSTLIKADEQAIPNVISSLAELFKDNATGGIASNDIDYVSVLLYAILLIQSLMLLINYIKRLFYVTLLSLLAPIVIIYDFFISAI
ncbi:MAG: hypothetical protein J6A15_02060 [Clostridia bacterium]|nr:hypothetical protein [Clostridia bacterium]